MKKNFLKTFALACVALFSTAVNAQTIEFDEIVVAPGASADVDVYITTQDASKVWATQFNVYYDAGISINNVEMNAALFTGEGAKAQLTHKDKAGFYVVAINNGTGNVLEGLANDTKTKVGTITFAADESMTEGDYTLTIKQGKINELGGTSQKVADFTVNFKVGEATGINEVSAQNVNAPIYSIAGARMNGNLQKGIYVQNGKKFIVK